MTEELMYAQQAYEYERHLEIMRQDLLRPSVMFQSSLRIGMDGNKWSVLLGENLAVGCHGFGDTLYHAMEDFDANFNRLKTDGTKV